MGLEDVEHYDQIRAAAASQAGFLRGKQRDRLQNLALFLTLPEIRDFFVLHFQQVRIPHLLCLLRFRLLRQLEEFQRRQHLQTRDDRVGARDRGDNVSRDFLDGQERARGDMEGKAAQVCEGD